MIKTDAARRSSRTSNEPSMYEVDGSIQISKAKGTRIQIATHWLRFGCHIGRF